jgi:long-chain acyl-CoA synthetase
MERIWLARYPKGVPAEIDPDRHRSIVALFRAACARFRARKAYTSLGGSLTFAALEEESAALAAYLRRDLGLRPGDRIALQMPNLLAYPVALFAALRAGLVVVNTNPLYTPREMEHQFRDAGVRAIVILANFASRFEEVLPRLSALPPSHVLVAESGDLLPTIKRVAVNAAVRYVKHLVPPYRLPSAVPLHVALDRGRRHGTVDGAMDDADVAGEDLAFLQYTGGTSGVPKGTMLTHRNIVANVQQAVAWMSPLLREAEEIVLTPLPLYHIFSMTVNCLTFMHYGAENVLIADPRDVAGLIEVLRSTPVTVMTGVNTLFNALLGQPGFAALDFSRLKISVAGAMALQTSVAERWRAVTRSPIVEGYGLTEASPVVCCNPIDGTDRTGTIGLPFPSTDLRIVDAAGAETPRGEPGELQVRGPQVMRGYWQHPEETAQVLTDGWLSTGDIAHIDADGFVRIVDRKKDMIKVSGFNVYPTEIEDVVAGHPAVLEVAAVGVSDDRTGQAIKLFVVKRTPELTAEVLIDFCRTKLTAYKVPRLVEFRNELPKTNVGKILRRALR